MTATTTITYLDEYPIKILCNSFSGWQDSSGKYIGGHCFKVKGHEGNCKYFIDNPREPLP